MSAVQVNIGTSNHLDPTFAWYEVFASETNLALGAVEASAEWSTIDLSTRIIHANVSAGETWYFWVRPVYDQGARSGTLVALGSILISGAVSASFLSLTDTPNSYTGHGEKAVAVKADESGLEFIDFPLSSGGGSEGVSLPVFYGARVRLNANTAGDTTAALPAFNTPWDTLIEDTSFDGHRFWLGANFDFITTDVDITNNTITETGHGFVTGEGPFRFYSSTTLPAGISSATKYWPIVVDSNTFKIALSRADALAGTPVDITSQGTGTHTCNRGRYFVIPPGVTRISVHGMLVGHTDLAGFLLGQFFKDDATFVGTNIFQSTDAIGNKRVSGDSDAIPVSAGEMLSMPNLGADAYTLLGGASNALGVCWFSIRVEEAE